MPADGIRAALNLERIDLPALCAQKTCGVSLAGVPADDGNCGWSLLQIITSWCSLCPVKAVGSRGILKQDL